MISFVILNKHLSPPKKKQKKGTSLAIQGLRLPLQGAWVRSLVRELRSHVLRAVCCVLQPKKTNNETNKQINTCFLI